MRIPAPPKIKDLCFLHPVFFGQKKLFFISKLCLCLLMGWGTCLKCRSARNTETNWARQSVCAVQSIAQFLVRVFSCRAEVPIHQVLFSEFLRTVIYMKRNLPWHNQNTVLDWLKEKKIVNYSNNIKKTDITMKG